MGELLTYLSNKKDNEGKEGSQDFLQIELQISLQMEKVSDDTLVVPGV